MVKSSPSNADGAGSNPIWRIEIPFLVRMTSKGLFKGGGVSDGLQMRAKKATDRQK